jgi:hypothetical protein
MHIRTIVGPAGCGKTLLFQRYRNILPELKDLDHSKEAIQIYLTLRNRGGPNWYEDHELRLEKDIAFKRLLDHLIAQSEPYTILTSEPTFCMAELTVGVVPLATDLLRNMRLRAASCETGEVYSTIEAAIDAVEAYKSLFYARRIETVQTPEEALQLIQSKLSHALSPS